MTTNQTHLPTRDNHIESQKPSDKLAALPPEAWKLRKLREQARQAKGVLK